jgi:predicted transcriptional regulator
MNEVTFTFRVDETLKEEFAAAAKKHDRTGAQLLRCFMREFVQGSTASSGHDTWFCRQVQTGVGSANAGRV